MQKLSFYIETFGCQMNEQDSLRTEFFLSQAGYRQTFSTFDADILIINTCSIRRKAEEKAYSLLGRYRLLKQKRPNIIIAVGGCVAQQEGKALLERMPYVNLVFGPHHVFEIDRLINRCIDSDKRFVSISQAKDSTDDLVCPGISDKSGLKAYMTIMEGCNNFCSYCIVPYVRGRERSRPCHALYEEASSLVDRGIKEITLLGQNVNAYRSPDRNNFYFADLLESLSEISGLKRLRFTTSHPKDLSPNLIDCFGRLDPLCEHIHLPLQACSDSVLAAMNRKYTIAEYLDKITALRKNVPEISITSDIIVGFPGEEKNDFEETLKIIKEIQFDSLFAFKYSPRSGTKAAALNETVSEEEKRQRLSALLALQQEITLKKHICLEGSVKEIFVEGKNRNGSQWMGRTRTNKIVNFSASSDVYGHFLDITIKKGCDNSLVGMY